MSSIIRLGGKMTETIAAETTPVTVDLGAAASQQQQASSFSIPEQYQSKGWAEKIKSTDDLFKAYDHSQQLIGKRPAGIPTADASDDEWNQFYKAMGRPDEPTYDFPEVEGLPEGFDASAYKETAAKIMHEAGLTPKQASKLYQSFMNNEKESAGKQQEQHLARQKELDAQFENLTKEHFGDDIDKYTELTKTEFEKFVPQSLKQSFSKIQDMPDVLTALMAYTKGKQSEIERVKKAYGDEGTVVTGSQAKSQSIDDIRSELASMNISKAAQDFTHIDHKKTMARIDELRSMVARHYAPK